MGGDPVSSGRGESFLGLPKVLSQADYVVLTEFEYRECSTPELRGYFPEFSAVYDSVMANDRKFTKLITFSEPVIFFGVTFKKRFIPADWQIPNPDITILKRRR
jgi:hypothetical protein